MMHSKCGHNCPLSTCSKALSRGSKGATWSLSDPRHQRRLKWSISKKGTYSKSWWWLWVQFLAGDAEEFGGKLHTKINTRSYVKSSQIISEVRGWAAGGSIFGSMSLFHEMSCSATRSARCAARHPHPHSHCRNQPSKYGSTHYETISRVW